MAEANELHDPWLVAVWPGMGSVALLAGSYLIQELGAQPVAELDATDFFELQNVDVNKGVAKASGLPRSTFFEWRDPKGRRDLLVFFGEAQPNSEGYTLCQRVVEYAANRGVKRLFTFAAMATQLQLGTKPRVFAAATDRRTLNEVKNSGVEIMEDGQISGLNGVLLAAGVERGLHGTCLLGELPFFAVGVPNPRAALAVLGPFARLAGLELDFTELRRQAKAVEQNLKQLLEQMNQAASDATGEIQTADEDEDEEDGAPSEGQEAEEPPQPQLDPRTRRRIEVLFDQARRDRSKAIELKQELDRFGVFGQYEDRFLDLFRKAE